ncbi:MAG: biopolymer transporter ExbD [bacterium]
MAATRRNKTEARIPSDSMADIAFLLIIFFLVTTNFNQEMGLSMTLPPISDAQEVKVRQSNILNIWVNAAGEILMGDEIVNLQQVEPEVKQRLAENPLLIISLKADRNTDYDAFIQVLDEIKKSGAKKISLAEPD